MVNACIFCHIATYQKEDYTKEQFNARSLAISLPLGIPWRFQCFDPREHTLCTRNKRGHITIDRLIIFK